MTRRKRTNSTLSRSREASGKTLVMTPGPVAGRDRRRGPRPFSLEKSIQGTGFQPVKMAGSARPTSGGPYHLLT